MQTWDVVASTHHAVLAYPKDASGQQVVVWTAYEVEWPEDVGGRKSVVHPVGWGLRMGVYPEIVLSAI